MSHPSGEIEAVGVDVWVWQTILADIHHVLQHVRFAYSHQDLAVCLFDDVHQVDGQQDDEYEYEETYTYEQNQLRLHIPQLQNADELSHQHSSEC